MSIRPVQKEDVKFIFDSWANSWRREKWAGIIPNHRYHEIIREVIEGLIARGALLDVVEEDGRIHAWICHEKDRTGRMIIHYLYSRDKYSEVTLLHYAKDTQGYITPGYYTHRIPLLTGLLSPDWIHAPEIARRK